MTIRLNPSQEQAIRDAIRAGQVASVEEFIDRAIAGLPPRASVTPGPAAKNLVELLQPLRGLLDDDEIDRLFSRNPSSGRSVDLS